MFRFFVRFDEVFSRTPGHAFPEIMLRPSVGHVFKNVKTEN